MVQKITFTVAAEIVENATSGILLGDFNNWNFEKGIDLKLQKDGSLKASKALESGTYQYRYLLNDGRWVNDGNADAYAYAHEFFIDNCVITVPDEAIKAVATPQVVEAPIVKKVVPAKKAPVAPIEEKKVATKTKKIVEAPVEIAPVATKKIVIKAVPVTKTAKAKK